VFLVVVCSALVACAVGAKLEGTKRAAAQSDDAYVVTKSEPEVETAAATAQRVAKEQAKELEVKRAAKKKEEEARLAARLKVIEENTDRTARRKKKLLTNFDPSSTSAADNLPTSLRTGDRVGKITFESFGDYNADHRDDKGMPEMTCLADGKNGACGWFNGWSMGDYIEFVFDKPYVIDAIRMDMQHACGTDLFAMYGVFDEKPVLLGEPFTIPTPALDTRHARDTFTMVFGNKKKFQVYRMVKLQTDVDGRDSGSPDIYEIEFPSAADLNRVEEL